MSKAKLKGAEINCIAKIGGKMKANDCYRCFALFMVLNNCVSCARREKVSDSESTSNIPQHDVGQRKFNSRSFGGGD